VRAKSVDGDRKGRDHSVDSRLLNQQGFATARRLHFAIRQFGDFQLGCDRLGDAFQLADFVEVINPIAKGKLTKPSGHANFPARTLMRALHAQGVKIPQTAGKLRAFAAKFRRKRSWHRHCLKWIRYGLTVKTDSLEFADCLPQNNDNQTKI
jgi:hypothetical protein